jgi:2-polyprenyl-6-methoxyphenol hydroxylase-like FAD-dependent oxidoreductase
MYDAIVIGARCAGSPTAMLLARAGHRVLLVDRAGFPSDTLSTHYIHQSGVAHLKRWGLLDRIAGAGAAAIRNYTLDLGPFALQGAPPPLDGVADAYSLRRSALDHALVEAAAEAGAEVRAHLPVEEIVIDEGRVTGIRSRRVTEHARIVIGADGLGSLVARSVGTPTYSDRGTWTCAYYTYWRDVEMDGVELYPRPGRAIIATPTNGGQVMTAVNWPSAEFHTVRADVERHFLQALELAPPLAARIRPATRTERFRGTSRLPNFYRRPYGDGWALVGDAGYHKDPILALGISDAFRDAQLLADAIDTGLSGRTPLAHALLAYEQRRNELAAPGFQRTLEFARLEPPPSHMQQLFLALRENPSERDRLFGTFAGTVDAAEYFAADNLARILGAPAATRKPIATSTN